MAASTIEELRTLTDAELIGKLKDAKAEQIGRAHV